LNPFREIGKLCHERGIMFHVDAAQMAGRARLNVNEIGTDLLTLSAHKMYGPMGVGAIFVRSETALRRLRPQMLGGGHQRGLRSGTMATPLIVGFGVACEIATDSLEVDESRIRQLTERLWTRFQSEIPNIVLNGAQSGRIAGNLNVSFVGVPSEALMVVLRDTVAVSAGSACTSANPKPSHVLQAMGIHGDRLNSAIRFGLGRFNTTSEVEYVADQVQSAVAELRRHL
jgi:cysteine desulfurase